MDSPASEDSGEPPLKSSSLDTVAAGYWTVEVDGVPLVDDQGALVRSSRMDKAILDAIAAKLKNPASVVLVKQPDLRVDGDVDCGEEEEPPEEPPGNGEEPPPEPVPPGLPGTPQVEQTGTMQATATWAPGEGAEKYKVRWGDRVGGAEPFEQEVLGTSVVIFPSVSDADFVGFICVTSVGPTGLESAEPACADIDLPQMAGRPENLTLEAEGDQVRASWDPAERADGYRVRVSDEDGQTTDTQETTETSLLLSLEDGDGVIVTARRGEWWSGLQSNFEVWEAPTAPENPSPIVDFAVEEMGVDFAILRWTLPDDGTGEPANADVRFGTPTLQWGSAWPDRSRVATPAEGAEVGDVIRHTISGLTPDAPYEFRAVPFRGTLNEDAVFGTITGRVSGSTLEEPPPPPPELDDETMTILRLNPPDAEFTFTALGEELELIYVRQETDERIYAAVETPDETRGWVEASWDGNQLRLLSGAPFVPDDDAGFSVQIGDPEIAELESNFLCYELPDSWDEGDPIVLAEADNPEAGVPWVENQ